MCGWIQFQKNVHAQPVPRIPSNTTTTPTKKYPPPKKQVDWLAQQPGVHQLFHPKLTQRKIYDAYRRPNGGYGGLFSLSLKEGLSPTAFYDALDVYKGPSLGTNYTLACPYTLLVGFAWARGWVCFWVREEGSVIVLSRHIYNTIPNHQTHA